MTNVVGDAKRGQRSGPGGNDPRPPLIDCCDCQAAMSHITRAAAVVLCFCVTAAAGAAAQSATKRTTKFAAPARPRNN
jgi:hypothetical protein